MNRRKRRKQRGRPQAPNSRKQARRRANESRRTDSRQSTEESAGERASRQPQSNDIVSLTPLAPVIVRSGRPFDNEVRPGDARFPPPSTLAGCLRTAWARANGEQPPFAREFAQTLAGHAVSGPLLLLDGQVLVPKPANAIYVLEKQSHRCIRATPRPFLPGCNADLPDTLLPVQAEDKILGKPVQGPEWWRLTDVRDFNSGVEIPDFSHFEQTGWSPSIRDRRTHVAIDPRTGTSAEGQLFQTEGIDFDLPKSIDRSRRNSPFSWQDGPRLLARFNASLKHSVVHLGGERRMASLTPEPAEAWPLAPPEWAETAVLQQGMVLTLLTPGIFKNGYRPGWLDQKLTGCPPGAPDLQLQLVAVATGRWQPHSGWDLANQRPRSTRKLVPPGATYWFRILGNAAPENLKALWLTNLSDEEQDRLDGFGLALPSPWTPVEQTN